MRRGNLPRLHLDIEDGNPYIVGTHRARVPARNADKFPRAHRAGMCNIFRDRRRISNELQAFA